MSAATVEELRAELESNGFRDIPHHPKNPQLRVGARVRNYGEQYARAEQYGTAFVRAIMRRGTDENPDSWERSYGRPNIEVIAERDPEFARSFGALSTWSDYGTVLVEPQRVQLKRTKGWRKPPNTVLIARPSKWGNPYVVRHYELDYPKDEDWTERDWRRMAVSDFRGLIEGRWGEEGDYPSEAEIRAELAGKNLACWCPASQPCHADVLLELANAPTDPKGPSRS